MDNQQLAYELEKEILNKSPEEQEGILESTQAADNGTKVNSFNSSEYHGISSFSISYLLNEVLISQISLSIACIQNNLKGKT